MINEQRLLQTFLNLVKIDSPSGHEKAVVKHVTELLEGLSLPLQISTDTYGNIICKTVSTETPILLTAHLDTVEPGRGINPVIKDGIIQSDGKTILGADNKVGIAVIIESLTSYFEKYNTLSSLEVVFTVSEEVGNLGAINLDYSNLKSKLGYSFDGSETVGSITVASPFYTRFDIKILGKSTHAGKPEDGINPITVFTDAMQNVPLGRLHNETLCNIGMVSGGSARNSVPSSLTLNGEVRSYAEATLEQTLNNIYTQFNNCCEKYNAKFVFEKVRENGGFEYSDQDADIETISKTLTSAGFKISLEKSLGCYDANIFIDNGIKIINFGNGSKFNHTVDEQISIKNLNEVCRLGFEVMENCF